MYEMQIPKRQEGDVFRDKINKNKYIRLERKNGAMWDYIEYVGNQQILTAQTADNDSNWSFEQIEEKRPPITEWTLYTHWELYDVNEGAVINETEDTTQKVWCNVKRNRLYRAVRKHKAKKDEQEDILIPNEVVKRLHLGEETIISDDKKQAIDYIVGDTSAIIQRVNEIAEALGNDFITYRNL